METRQSKCSVWVRVSSKLDIPPPKEGHRLKENLSKKVVALVLLVFLCKLSHLSCLECS